MQMYATGSPPQVRGKLSAFSSCAQPSRITPAGAGKTKFCRFQHGSLGDHPRRCGENRLRQLGQRNRLGSPPQVRGKPPEDFPGAAAFRITPAGAGKTRHYFARKRNGWDHPRRCGENISL